MYVNNKAKRLALIAVFTTAIYLTSFVSYNFGRSVGALEGSIIDAGLYSMLMTNLENNDYDGVLIGMEILFLNAARNYEAYFKHDFKYMYDFVADIDCEIVTRSKVFWDRRKDRSKLFNNINHALILWVKGDILKCGNNSGNNRGQSQIK